MAQSYVKKLKIDVRDALQKKGKYKNVHQVPTLEKIVVSIGIGTHMQKSKDFTSIEKNLTALTGQKPIVTKAKKAISNFKLRQGMPVGLVVTLRGEKMYGFLNKLIAIVLPRVRDFRGVPSKSFDGAGNYSLGLREQNVFTEVLQDDNLQTHGVQITFTTTATNNEEGLALLTELGMPFQK